MIRSMTELFAGRVTDRDGSLGLLHDTLIDRVVWMVRYLVVVTEGWLPGWFALVPTEMAEPEAPGGAMLRIDLARREFERCSRDPASLPGEPEARVCLASSWPPTKLESLRHDPALHSLRGWKGYHLMAADDEAGTLEDVLADDVTWLVRYLGVRTAPGTAGRRVLVPVSLVEEIDTGRKLIQVDTPAGTVTNAPEEEPAVPLERSRERRIYEHYDRPPYWG